MERMIKSLLLLLSFTCMTLGQAPVVISPAVRDLVVAIGSSQKLECTVTQNDQTPPPNFKWKKDGVDITSTTVTIQTGSSYIHKRTVTISDFKATDQGDYTCSYTATESTIKVAAISETVTDSVYYFGNKSATLACTISKLGGSGNTGVTFIRWLKDDTPVSSLEGHERFTSINNGSLFIDRPTRDDAGLYNAQYNITDLGEYNCSVEYTAGPLVLDMAKSKNVVKKEELEIRCMVKGYPPATVTWKKDDVILVEDARITLEADDGYENAILRIKPTEYSDEGKYMCEAYSSQFNETVKKSILIRIKDPLAWLWPLIGIIVEIIVLIIVVFLCTKFKGSHTQGTTPPPSPTVEGRSNRRNKKDT